MLAAGASQTEPIRVATYNTELSQPGPGLLLRDIIRADNPQVVAVIQTISAVAPDILVLQGIDYDLQGSALAALAKAIGQDGPDYRYRFALPPNAGRQTGIDMDGDGRAGHARDGQGYGRFLGDGALAVLSRFPILPNGVQDYSTLLWRDLPGALLPRSPHGPFPTAEAQEIQRLSSHGHWVVPIDLPHAPPITLMTFYATPPVFDGPEDRNGKRNHDEIMFWDHYLAGRFDTPPDDRFVLLGNANLDPDKGEGRKSAITTLLHHPMLQDPLQGQPTVTFDGLGDMRTDYLLPSSDWRVVASGVARNASASRHGLIWADLDR